MRFYDLTREREGLTIDMDYEYSPNTSFFFNYLFNEYTDDEDMDNEDNKLTEEEKPDLIILGKQAIDGDNNQTGQMRGSLLGYPQATNASEVSINSSSVQVTREIDGGLQTLELDMPAIITTDLRLNEPRYASLPNIMKAKKKELNVIPVSDMGLDVSPRTELLSVELPPSREAGIIVETVDDLVDKLKNEAKVIQWVY